MERPVATGKNSRLRIVLVCKMAGIMVSHRASRAALYRGRQVDRKRHRSRKSAFFRCSIYSERRTLASLAPTILTGNFAGP